LTHIPFVGKESWSAREGETPGTSSEGKDRDCGHISRGVTWRRIVAGAKIQADGCLPRIRRPYKTKGFAPRVSYIASLPLHLQPPPPIPKLPASTSQPSSSSHPPIPIIRWSHRVDPISPSSAWRALSTAVSSVRGPPPRSGGCPVMRTRRHRPMATLCPSLTFMSGDSPPPPTSSLRGC